MLGQQGHPAPLVVTAVLDSLDLGETWVQTADEDLLEKREHLDLQESLDPQGFLDLLDLRGPEVLKLHQAPEDLRVYPDLREDQEQPEVQV